MSNTKWKLANALKKLMKGKSLHKITIQDIVEESGLTRQSFYYHFHDIYEIIEWMCKNYLLKDCVIDESSPDEWIYVLFKNVNEDRIFYRKVIREFGRGVLEKTVDAEIKERMKAMLSLYQLKESEVFSFLTTSLLNYLIIIAEAHEEEIHQEQIEQILLFLKIGIQGYCGKERNIQCA